MPDAPVLVLAVGRQYAWWRVQLPFPLRAGRGQSDVTASGSAGSSASGAPGDKDLIEDLRYAAGYAARAGIVLDASVLEALNQPRDTATVRCALATAVRVIAPMTLVDLRGGRDPFLDRNQCRARWLQAGLSVVALPLLIYVLLQTQALRAEQELQQRWHAIEAMNPQQRFDDIRRLVHAKKTFGEQPEQYREKIFEVRNVSSQLALMSADLSALETVGLYLPDIWKQRERAGAPASFAQDASSLGTEGASGDTSDPVCAEDDHGDLRLPEPIARRPRLSRDANMDRLSEQCFFWDVVSQNGGSYWMPDEPLAKISLSMRQMSGSVEDRMRWVIPFCFGALGAIVFLIRNLGNVRTPLTGAMQTLTRLLLGGVAGIAAGWMTLPNSTAQIASGGIYLQFLFAFLVGYGIDIFFTMLDRGRRMLLTESKPDTARQPA